MSPKKVTEEEFWITNVKQKMDVMLSDLGFCARAGKSYNLLDSRHFHYTKEQLQKSAESGSLYKKRDRIAIRKVQPEPPILPPGAYVSDQPFLIKPLRSQVVMEEQKFEELEIDEEKMVEEMIED